MGGSNSKKQRRRKEGVKSLLGAPTRLGTHRRFLEKQDPWPRVPGHPRVLGFSRSPASLGSAPFPFLSGGACLLVLQPRC